MQTQAKKAIPPTQTPALDPNAPLQPASSPAARAYLDLIYSCFSLHPQTASEETQVS